MTPLEIKAELIKKEITQKQLGESLNPPVSQSTIYQVIYGYSVSRRVMKAIADVIGVDVRKVFQPYFDKKQKKSRPSHLLYR